MTCIQRFFCLTLTLVAVALSARADFEVWFLRHGETTWNRERRLQGSVSYTKLTENGRLMAMMTGENLAEKGIRFDRIYTSPYDRAKETAEIVASKTGPAPQEDVRIREMCFGKYEGQTYGGGKYPDDNLRRFFEEPENYVPAGEGAESFDMVQARIREFLEGELKPLDGKVLRILCVAHSLVLKSLVRELAGEGASAEARKTLQPNCCVHVVRYSNGRFALVETGKVFYDAKRL